MGKGYIPPYKITPAILTTVAEIGELVGRYSATTEAHLTPSLRRRNRIRTIQSSLAIENNTLTLEQVTAVLDGKKVLGPPREIQEVRNAYAAYERLDGWNPGSLKDLLEAAKVVPIIDRRYPLSNAAEALSYLKEGHAQGKVVITVEHS